MRNKFVKQFLEGFWYFQIFNLVLFSFSLLIGQASELQVTDVNIASLFIGYILASQLWGIAYVCFQFTFPHELRLNLWNNLLRLVREVVRDMKQIREKSR